jgi:hypothetical protein
VKRTKLKRWTPKIPKLEFNALAFVLEFNALALEMEFNALALEMEFNALALYWSSTL